MLYLQRHQEVPCGWASRKEPKPEAIKSLFLILNLSENSFAQTIESLPKLSFD